MQIRWTRRLAGGAGVIAAVVIAASTDPIIAEEPAGTTGKVVAADVAFLQKGLEKTPEKPLIPTLRAAALTIALYGTADNRDAAQKVATAIAKKDYAGAKMTAAKLTAATGKTGDPAKLAEASKYELHELMSAFRKGPRGMNIETDIRTQAKKVTDLKVVEIAAGRTAAIGAYAMVLPSEKAAANPGNRKKWDGYTADMVKLANEVAADAAKGTATGLEKKLKALDASCTACHNEFRE
ncbi:MAG: hypothetical protein ACRC7O_08910 [Fimbriiglobus sp.]